MSFDIRVRVVWLLLFLHTSGGVMRAESRLSFKAQSYGEEDERIGVDSYYALWDSEWAEYWSGSVELIYNSISGATPDGSLPDDQGKLPTSHQEDERTAFVGSLTRRFDDWLVSGSFSYGEESDYDSIGGALTVSREFNQKNTVLSAGYGHTADRIMPSFFSASREKTVHDAFVGITQVLDAHTLLTVNLGYSQQDGYLNDPYKFVQHNFGVPPGLNLALVAKENRPSERGRYIVYGELRRRFPSVGGTVEAAYRFTHDDWDVDAHMVELGWYQDVGSRLILKPYTRYYHQSAAFFYVPSLVDTGINPNVVGEGTAPFFASDHRLSEMQTLAAGLKAIVKISESLWVDGAYERYELKGLDGVTSEQNYTKANLFTFGITYSY